MKRIITFQCEDPALTPYQIGDKIRDTLATSLAHNGYLVLPDDRYDPDWPIHVQKDEREFVVILVCQSRPTGYWNISLEDLNYKLVDDVKLQEQINPIIHKTVSTLANASNISWHNDFTFLK